MRRVTPIFVICVLMAGCGGGGPKSAAPSPQVAARALAQSPPELASLHQQANRLLDGGADAFKARLHRLRGHPVVVNKWGSWCGPCREEFPFFQRQAIKRGRKIAFIGVDGNDNDADARTFLRRYPVSYPSYKDPQLGISASFHGVQAFPTTAFYDSRGGLAYLHQGAYPSERDLSADIARYAR